MAGGRRADFVAGLAVLVREHRDSQPREILLQHGETVVGRDLLRKHGRHAALRPDMVFIGLDDATLFPRRTLWPEEIEASPVR